MHPLTSSFEHTQSKLIQSSLVFFPLVYYIRHKILQEVKRIHILNIIYKYKRSILFSILSTKNTRKYQAIVLNVKLLVN